MPGALKVRNLPLEAAQAELALGPEHVAIQAVDPLSSARRDIEVAERLLDMRRYVAPIELRVMVGEIGRRSVAQLFVHPDFLELTKQRVGLPQVMRIAELSNEVGSADKHPLF